MHYPTSMFLSVCGLLALLAHPAEAKVRSTAAPRSTFSPVGLHSQQIADELERRFTPFFESKAGGMRTHRAQQQPLVPTHRDLFLLVKNWQYLDSGFRDLYIRATGIPASFTPYSSPSGRFEVYYATAQQDADEFVDATDEYGFGSIDWRTRDNTPNGIPDYIDEIAWALDSAWSMEIDRLQFPHPSSSITNRGTSGVYKVAARALDDGYYAFTFPGSGVPSPDTGYTSYIEIRNEWSGWPMGYDTLPENAVRVTCVHEFFHSIQYAMTNLLVGAVSLDDFPVAWLEGTAVMMEELAFPDINDYVQYARNYFYSPANPMLNDAYDSYRNGLLALYLYLHSDDSPSVEFVRSVFMTNYAQATPFHQNLLTASSRLGKTWPVLLNGYHAHSYFSGNRADTSYFLPDAAMFPTWGYNVDSSFSRAVVVEPVTAYSMTKFGFERKTQHSDSLHIGFTGMGNATGLPGDNQWAATVILTLDDTTVSEVRPLSVSATGLAETMVSGWQSLHRAVVVATNGASSGQRYMSVAFEPHAGGYRGRDTLLAYPNPVRLKNRRENPLAIEGKRLLEVWVRQMNGTLVSHAAFDTSDIKSGETSSWRRRSYYQAEWYVQNDAGREIVPGTYSLIVGYKDPDFERMLFRKTKVLVLP